MHVAFVSTQFISVSFVGGLANYLQRVGLSLIARGHKPTIFMISDTGGVESYKGIQLVRVAGKRHSVLQRLAAGQRHANAYHSMLLNRAIARMHTADPIDIVQYTNYRATALHRVPGIPSVIRVSSFRPLWDPFHPTAQKSRSRRMAARLEERAFYNVDAVYSPSTVLAEAIRTALRIEVDVVEPPFVMDEVALDDSVVRETVGERPFFLYAGHLTQRKGVLVLRDILKDLLNAYPHHDFVFVGRTDDSGERITPELLSDAAGTAADRVRFTGALVHSQMYPFFAAADAVILPSIIDNIANTGLEAMAMGGIVVGTDGGSFEQLIDEGRSGFLAVPGEPQSLLDAVHRSQRVSPEERPAIRAAAQARIGELSPEHTIPALLEYYRRVIERKAP